MLSDEFVRQNGFDAAIEVHKVTSAQCVAVNFLSRMRHPSAIAPRLDLVSTVRPPVGFGNRNVDLLMVADDGLVYKLTDRLRAEGDTKSFSLFVRQVSPGSARPQLALVVASSKPLEVLNHLRQFVRADQVFTHLLAEIEQGGQSVDVNGKCFFVQYTTK